ncbi:MULTISPECIES: type II toxin-antitoxin system PemK/MazF family toxin [unclassified Streptomyces]|uniref:type II toxin-antitoxin system PemK/MazF family toxin n=1 Tax=unclassified Streptomyces TaxID=2593676 RepID=UPI002DDB6E95|nr:MULTISPECIES: type II toxin-antitoxin system PemK/MazF family toxin [unclassified Streptomyces]WSA95582.1 type II toxin-antitoxin system PemK/MazF family toxin [Streptomyces sp. NBC_01795]WSB80000.1 type II toxin-antitoxin system PemK/MazF family toxin [Streptomyces sp. NBC_01775]WSS11793.1 type II toxin-antitoxin system PemK/MazF family toxin [Streptomyces sp. NBC_01186]WSS40506.1 type II toxin-antitoxin system PemK/MazF family toxin [Streptomyces sp. NBC_01187]
MSHVRDEGQDAAGFGGAPDEEGFPGRYGPSATVEVDPRSVGPVRTAYAPDPDGDPDPGEIVWTWVPYEEGDGRGKDRPVLIVAREGGGEQPERGGGSRQGVVLAVQLTSREHHGDQEWLPLGSGPWDREGRDSWVGIDRVLRLRPGGMRREACALDRARFQAVVHRLQQVYGWR